MILSRKGQQPDRRVVCTLRRHERHTEATIIINKIKASSTYAEPASLYGVLVRYEYKPGLYEFRYLIHPEKLGGRRGMVAELPESQRGKGVSPGQRPELNRGELSANSRAVK